jgi:hypothetical protein
MKLLIDEEILVSSNENSVILTSHRITMRNEVWGKSHNISIFLEDISSIETHYKSNIIFLIIGLLFAFIGLFMLSKGGGNMATGGFVIGGIFIAIWWFTRKHLVTISSDGGNALNFVVEGMADNKIDDFVTKVQEAKLKRVNQLYKQ